MYVYIYIYLLTFLIVKKSREALIFGLRVRG